MSYVPDHKHFTDEIKKGGARKLGKKVMLSLLAVLVMLSLAMSGCSSNASGKSKKELTIWTFTNEAKYAVKKFKERYPGIKVNLVYITNNNYVQKLISVLQVGRKVPDVFFVENTYWPQIRQIPRLENLSQPPFNADKLIQQQFPYIQKTEKDSHGNVKGLGYQGTPGAFYYRRDLAKKYLGTDNPKKVSEMISTWPKIMKIGQRVAKESHGKVHALASWNDIQAVQSANIKKPWVVNGKLVIDPARLKMVELSKEARKKNVVAKYINWSAPWTASMQKGTVMFYAMPTWGLPYVFEQNAPKTSGKWGLAHPPKPFSGGGTFMAMYYKSPHKKLAWKFMKFYCSDPKFSKNLAKTQQYFLSNQKIDAELAPKLKSKFLHGQKYFQFFEEEGKNVPYAPQTKYDKDINSLWSTRVTDYLDGRIKTKAEMIRKFKIDVSHDFPKIKVDFKK